MANEVFISNQRNKSFHLIGLFCLVFLMQKSNAREFKVGGSNWAVRNGTNTETYNQWAERNRFQIGDALTFIYPPNQDSVLVVSANAYDNCSTDSPMEKFTDGHTVFTFNHSGPFYFISGNGDNCVKNQKLVVVVMADRSNRSSSTTNSTTASPPSPLLSSGLTPTPAPSPPSPAPSEESPPAMEGAPTPAPVPAGGQSPPKSAASSVFVSVGGFLGAAVASSIILA